MSPVVPVWPVWPVGPVLVAPVSPVSPVSVAADCTVAATVQLGASGDAVACLESKLMAAGLLQAVDTVFDAATDQAVRAYQTAQGLEVDGIFGRKSAQAMGIWGKGKAILNFHA